MSVSLLRSRGRAMALGAWVALCAAHVQAQSTMPPLSNVVQLSASGAVEVTQDWLEMTLGTTVEGPDAVTVQRQLQQALDSALAVLKPQVQGRALQLRTGSTGVYPRYDKDGKISGWQGRAEMAVEGTDFARITQAVARASSLSVSHIGFGVSREAQAQVQERAQAQAVEAFRQRAQQLAKQFGFSSYSLREVSVNSQGLGPMVRMQAMPAAARGMVAKAEMDALPVEAGRTQVVVEISGSVQLQ